MPSKTAARSGAKTNRSKAGSRQASPTPRKKPTSPAKRRNNPSVIASAGAGVGRAARATWLMVARGVGGSARSVGRARDLEPGHRRDGIALALLGVAVVIAASTWFGAAGPVGAWIDTVLRTVIGSAVVLTPILLAAIAVVLMRTEPHPEAMPRLVLGAAMIGLPVLGLWHLWSGSPLDPVARQHAAGFIGFAMGGPLSDGLTAWIATPLLIIGVLFGLLLMTGTTIREVPAALSTWLAIGRGRDHGVFYDEDYEYDEGVTAACGGLLRRLLRRSGRLPRRRRTAVARRLPPRLADRHPLRQLPARRGADRPRACGPVDTAQEARQEAGRACAGPRRRWRVHAAVDGSVGRGRPAQAAQRGQRPDGRRHHLGAASVQG